MEECGSLWEGLENRRTGNAALHHFHDLLATALRTVLTARSPGVRRCVPAQFMATIITVDALNRQRMISQQDVDRGDGYALASKDKLRALDDTVRLSLEDHAPLGLTTGRVRCHRQDYAHHRDDE